MKKGTIGGIEEKPLQTDKYSKTVAKGTSWGKQLYYWLSFLSGWQINLCRENCCAIKRINPSYKAIVHVLCMPINTSIIRNAWLIHLKHSMTDSTAGLITNASWKLDKDMWFSPSDGRLLWITAKLLCRPQVINTIHRLCLYMHTFILNVPSKNIKHSCKPAPQFNW